MELPVFKYHPNPIETGSVVPSTHECVCCGEARGYIYTGPCYAEEELDEMICPWCIADGSANQNLDVDFTDAESFFGRNRAPIVPPEVIEEVCLRTPGFPAWQQEVWLSCCGDAAAFVGAAGWEELQRRWPEAIDSLRAEVRECFPGSDAGFADEYLHALNKENGPTAYVFHCLHCRRHLAYSDST